MQHLENSQIARDFLKIVSGMAMVVALSACNEESVNTLASAAQVNNQTAPGTEPGTTDSVDSSSEVSSPGASSSAAEGSSTALPDDNLVLHLETDAGVTAYSNIVTDWGDQSDANNSLSSVGAPEFVNNALNGFPAIRFDGYESRLERTSAVNLPEGNSNRTVMLLADYSGDGAGGVGYGSAECNRAFQAIADNNGNSAVQAWCSAHDANSDVDVVSAGWMIHTAILKNSEIQQYLNADLIDARHHTFDTASQQLVVGGKIGNTSFAKMSVAAVLIWDNALSPEDFAAALSYLQNKYLPASVLIAQPVDNTPAVGEDTPALPQPEPPGDEVTPITPPESPAQPAEPPVADNPVPPAAPEPAPQPAPAPVPAPAPAPAPVPVPAPTLLMTSTNVVGGGVELTWQSSNADECIASGAWTGSKILSGGKFAHRASIGDTFKLNCSNSTGSAIGLVSVTDRAFQISWQAPSADSQIASYGIHWGTTSGDYQSAIQSDPADGGQVVDLPAGTVYVAMTTSSVDGNRSAYSAEATLNIQ